ncbi:LytTR family DNA-binding domain-containing protein [Larkinella sp. C7]|jgi:DNA-binding LytR/AlgR family response regulator|uniref:LytR/AlgR family response regulator transcription factor n=1 Tax=Larkinella sp. C7 TaxID=2576607 RepID=UPI0011110C41|nr:LytTR family DNA-binding domain-containing protein [Larkinella sp. C7]
MNVRCLLIDDEPHAVEIIESYIELVDGLEIVGKCHNAIQAFSMLQSMPVDLLFLDIKMPKLSGTDFLRSLRNPPKVIFTTAYREYALDGFDLDVVDYLLKPIPFERFLRAVSKVMRLEPQHMANGISEPDQPPVEKELVPSERDAFLYFRADRKMVKVYTKDILYVESLKDYIKIITTNARPLVVKQAISSVEAMLPGRDFLRIHRSFIVAIDKISAWSPSHIEVAGQELPIGRLHQKDVGRALKMEV